MGHEKGFMTKDTAMSVGNMDKWVSGEVESFFAPHEVPPPPVIPDSNHNEDFRARSSNFKLINRQTPRRVGDTIPP